MNDDMGTLQGSNIQVALWCGLLDSLTVSSSRVLDLGFRPPSRAGAVAEAAYVKASNTEGDDWFGHSVSLSAAGNTLAVGAHREDSSTTGVNGDQTDNSDTNSGAVYIFERASTTWVQQAYLKASDTGAHDLFGWSVSLSASGDTMAVGAWSEDTPVSGAGTVYVFQRLGTGIGANPWHRVRRR